MNDEKEIEQLKEQLKIRIKEITGNLICESHPEVCNMRDSMYENLESQILHICMTDGRSVQEAIAHMEMELGHI